MKKLVKPRAIPVPLRVWDIIQVCIKLKHKSNSIVSFLRLVLSISVGKEQAYLVNVDEEVCEAFGIFMYCSKNARGFL